MSHRTLNRIVDFFSNQTTLPLRRSTMESDSRSRLIENEADIREEGIDDTASEQEDNDDNQGTSWLMRLDPVAIAHHGSIANTPNRVASTVQLPLRNGSERIIVRTL